MKRIVLATLFAFFVSTPAEGMVINEIMYHPKGANEVNYEWLELYNDYATPLYIGGWSFSEGISFAFPPGTVMRGYSYIVVCANKAGMHARYNIADTLLAGPFEKRLDNRGDRVSLVDKYGAVMAHVRYKDREPWPAGADGTGHSLALINTDLENDESESWAVSPQPLGSPGEPNGFKTETTITDTLLLDVGEEWKYFQGTEQPSDPANAWIEPDFDDSGWLTGETGIGYGDNDDATVLNDMQGNYLSVFCRKRFVVTNISSINTLMLKVDYDDGFIAYLNGEEIGRRNMGSAGEVFTHDRAATATVGELPESAEVSASKSLLLEGPNVLAIQIHNGSSSSSDLSMIPSMLSRTVKTTGGVTPMPVVINELLANPPLSIADFRLQIAECQTTGGKSAIRNPKSEISADDTFVELTNNSGSPVDIGLAYLSDDRDNLTKYRIPQGTVLGPGSFIAFTRTQMGFRLPAGDGAIYFTSSDEERIIDAYAYGATLSGISRGRYPDGDEQWYNMVTPTPGETNQVSVNTSIVINELMYHPYEGDSSSEYIELYNRAERAVDISGWSFSKGVDFSFPPGTVLAPDEYLVVVKDLNAIDNKYNIENVIGEYTGSLDNEGEKIELVDFLGNVVDGVRYAGGGRWPIWAAGWGSSLELIDPKQDNSAPSAWAASDESNKAEWDYVEYEGQHKGGESEFHFFLMHRGECLIDDISVKYGGQEHIANGSFESGTSGWKIDGNHIQSTIYTEETHSGSSCLKIVATGRGDTGANRIERQTSPSLYSGRAYTVSFWVKWRRGINLIYTRTHNQGMPKASRFRMAGRRGTPGRENSVYSPNLGPVISDVTQHPIVPKSSEPVRVNARISDSDGVASATLYYKGNYDGLFDSVKMYDDGFHGDRRPGDGLYGGEIPARGSRDLMEFYIVARDTLAASQRFPAKGGVFCLYQIEDSAPSTKLPIYRILLTRESDQKFRSQNRLSNELQDCTFVLNNTQIYYNCGIRTRGSGWTRRNHSNADQYRIRFPADQPLRGVQREINLDWHARSSKQEDRLAHHLMRELGGVPTSYQQYVHVRFNASFRALAEDVVKVDGDYIRFYWPDDAAGTLFKVDDHFEWTDSWSHSHWDAYLKWQGPNTNWDEAVEKEKFRWNWKLRTNEKKDDYGDFLNFVYFMDPNKTGTANFDRDAESVLDVDVWLRILCVRFLIDDWDTLGFDRGKNAYIYKLYHDGDGTPEDPPREGRWILLPWDSDLTFNNTNAPIVTSKFRSIKRMLERPRYKRWYYSYYAYLIDGPFSRQQIDRVVDGVYQVLAGEQGQPSNPTSIKNFVSGRINVIRAKLPQSEFEITTNSGEDFESKDSWVVLEGTAPIAARTIMLRLNDGPAQTFEPTWKNLTRWEAMISLNGGESRFELTGVDPGGNVVGTDTITVSWGLSPTQDYDNDGLFDKEEAEVYHTDYQNPDTDGDGLKDGVEVHLYNSDPTKKDTDEDGLEDGEEVNVYFTDPTSPDTDEDTLPDKWEVVNNLDPNADEGDNGASGDPDGDGLSNLDEYGTGTDPQNPDTDDDGMSDSWEIRWGLNPIVGTGSDGPDDDPDEDGLTNVEEFQHDTNPYSSDTDEDTLDDLWEVQSNLDPNSAEGDDGADGDPDNDGLSNLDEYRNITCPTNPDTDGDGMDDFWEVENQLDPLLPTGYNGADGDPDADGITNLQEYTHGLDPWTPNEDTDEDGMSDLWEITHGLSPTSSQGDDGPDGDPDDDGSPNIKEMLAGTDPQSPASVFAIVSVSSNPPSITISWTTVADRHYRILAADNPEGPWTAIAEGKVGTGQPDSFADVEAGPNSKRFYKVEVY